MAKKGSLLFTAKPEIRKTYDVIIQIWEKHGLQPPVITSGDDSIHTSANSKHYFDKAIDIRGNIFKVPMMEKLANEIQAALGPKYFVDAEVFSKYPANNHIHIEYDPK